MSEGLDFILRHQRRNGSWYGSVKFLFIFDINKERKKDRKKENYYFFQCLWGQGFFKVA